MTVTPLRKCQAKGYRRITTSSSTTTKSKQRQLSTRMSKRPAQTPEKQGAAKRRIIDLDDLFEVSDQRALQHLPTTTPNRSGGGGGNQQPALGGAAAAKNQAIVLASEQRAPQQQLPAATGGNGFGNQQQQQPANVLAPTNNQAMALGLQQQQNGGGGGQAVLGTGGGGGQIRTLAELEQLAILKREIEDRKRSTERAKQPIGVELLEEFGSNGLTNSDIFWCGWNDKHLFGRLRLKLATIYASLVNLDNVGETLVTNAQFSNGDLQITIYGWDKQAQLLNNQLNGQEGKVVEFRSLVPKENKSARSQLPFRLLFTSDSVLQILPGQNEGNSIPDMALAANTSNAPLAIAASASSDGLDPNPCSSSSLVTNSPPTPRPLPREMHFAHELQSIIRHRPAGNSAAADAGSKAIPSGENQQQQEKSRQEGNPAELVIDLAGDDDEEDDEGEMDTDGESVFGVEMVQENVAPPPLTEYQIRRLTRNPWVHVDDLPDEDKDRADACSICQDVNNDRVAIQLRCGHRFHRHCGLKWLRGSGACPMCRRRP